jgi:signal peptidase I
MTKRKTPKPKAPAPKVPAESQPAPDPAAERVEETPFEAIASICSIFVIGLFMLTFLGQNFVIPSGSMEKTLLVGDHLVVDRITFAPPTHLNPLFRFFFHCDIPSWIPPLVHHREPKRGDIVVFFKPVLEDLTGGDNPQYNILVKRLIGVPGDHIHLRNGVVILNGVAQDLPKDADNSPNPNNIGDQEFLDEFPSLPPPDSPQVPDSWSKVDFPANVVNGDLVVPPGKYFMMGDHRHNSLDSRYWGFVPRENIVGRPLFNYWSFETSDGQYEQPGLGNSLKWMGHIALHFFTETRWSRTLHRVR